MKKRSDFAGYIDPYQPRRSNLRRGGKRTTTVAFNHRNVEGAKDSALTNKELAAINKEYKDKEYAVASAQGPHSLPEQHYPKSIFLNQKKEEDEDAE